MFYIYIYLSLSLSLSLFLSCHSFLSSTSRFSPQPPLFLVFLFFLFFLKPCMSLVSLFSLNHLTLPHIRKHFSKNLFIPFSLARPFQNFLLCVLFLIIPTEKHYFTTNLGANNSISGKMTCQPIPP